MQLRSAVALFIFGISLGSIWLLTRVTSIVSEVRAQPQHSIGFLSGGSGSQSAVLSNLSQQGGAQPQHSLGFHSGSSGSQSGVLSNLSQQGADLVITWLNGSDRFWRTVDASVFGCNRTVSPCTSCSPPRCTSYGVPVDETEFDLRESFADIRYLLRSYVKKGAFKNGLRNIYIVHSDLHPPPAFLNESNPRLHFVPHSKIIPSYALPTFDRATIVSHLHKIPHLREWFFYTNDDILLVNTFNWTPFVSSSGRILRQANSHEPQLLNRRWIEKMEQTNQKEFDSRWTPPLCCPLDDPLRLTGHARRQMPAECSSKTGGVRGRDDGVFLKAATISNQFFDNENYPPKLTHLIHTNRLVVCPDSAFRSNHQLVQTDFPCWKHGLVPKKAKDYVSKQLHDHGSALFVNLQGPGFDDAYCGWLYNKVNPLSDIGRSFLDGLFGVTSEFELTTYTIQEDHTSSSALAQLRYRNSSSASLRK